MKWKEEIERGRNYRHLEKFVSRFVCVSVKNLLIKKSYLNSQKKFFIQFFLIFFPIKTKKKSFSC